MKHEIEIPDLPEGYELGVPKVEWAHMKESYPEYISIPLNKKQPRRIVLEETIEPLDNRVSCNLIHSDDIIITIHSKRLWKIVEEKDEK
jgi:hypothetical protein